MDQGKNHTGWCACFLRPPWRTVVPVGVLILAILLGYTLWSPGAVVTDGRHDRGTNGLWLQHGWLGDDGWFERYDKVDQKTTFRSEDKIGELKQRLRRHHITDVFPHLAPTLENGKLPPVDTQQAERFLDVMQGVRVIPWIGGAWGVQAHPDRPAWRQTFAASVRALLDEHPRFVGVHINIEPCPSGNRDYVLLLEEVRGVLKRGEILSVAAYPPPTRWHPFPEVHWDEAYFREVASHADQLVVMMYDTSIHRAKLYESVMKDWTGRVLAWSGSVEVLLGLPAYEDADTDYHDPDTENLRHALAGVHAGLLKYDVQPKQYRGIAIYSEWELQEEEWAFFRRHFLKDTDVQQAP